MGKFILGIVVGLVIFPLALLGYFKLGQMPAAVGDKPFPFEKYVARTALRARIQREVTPRDLSTFTKDDIVQGAQVYRHGGCEDCHGLPAGVSSPELHVLYPQAPKLFAQRGNVAHDPVGATYWKVKNGIRLSGMPAYVSQFSDQQLWQVSAFLASEKNLPPEAVAVLQPQAMPVQAPKGAAPAVQAPAKKQK